MTIYQTLRIQVTLFLNTFQDIKLLYSFLLKNCTKRKPRKTLFLLYCRKKSGENHTLAVCLEHRKWKTQFYARKSGRIEVGSTLHSKLVIIFCYLIGCLHITIILKFRRIHPVVFLLHLTAEVSYSITPNRCFSAVMLLHHQQLLHLKYPLQVYAHFFAIPKHKTNVMFTSTLTNHLQLITSNQISFLHDPKITRTTHLTQSTEECPF